MQSKFALSALLVFSAFISACGDKNQSEASNENLTVNPNVIYGADHRLDLYEVIDRDWQNRAASTVALISAHDVSVTNSGYKIQTEHFGKSQGLCTTEPYYNQEVAGFCSGSLIAPDIIMTAGHCVRSLTQCKTTKFVFNFSYATKKSDPTVLKGSDVYSCKSLIKAELNSSTKTDFALIRLDRAVIGRDPLPLRLTGSIELDEPLTVIGHPTGLPTKIAGGANVRKNTSPAFFVANLDTYGGNSGSAVFNSDTGLVEGILVRGDNDFVYRNGCYVSNVCKDTGCRGEDVTRVSEVLPYLDLNELATVR